MRATNPKKHKVYVFEFGNLNNVTIKAHRNMPIMISLEYDDYIEVENEEKKNSTTAQFKEWISNTSFPEDINTDSYLDLYLTKEEAEEIRKQQRERNR